MNAVHAVLLGDGHDVRNVQVGADRLAGYAYQVRLVRLEAVQGVAVFVRIDGDGADAQLVRGAKHTNGDFAAVGDQQLCNFRHRRPGGARAGVNTSAAADDASTYPPARES